MPQGFSLSLTGLDQLQRKLGKRIEAVQKGVAQEIKASAINIQANARKRAPKNFGKLAQSIHTKSEGLTSDVIVGVSYGAYMEFGTGGKVSIPAGFSDFAAQFKGKGSGTMDEFLLAMLDWVKAKGISGTYSTKTRKRTGGKGKRLEEDFEVAYLIMRAILKHGVKAQPYLIPSYLEEKPKLIARLKTLLTQ